MLQALIESLVFLQVRSSLFELAKKTKFNLCRHISVTVILLVIINLLVIFIPSMKDIFGVVGMALWLDTYSAIALSEAKISQWQLQTFFSYFTGVTSANMLIFILPSSLYLKITNQDGDKGTQRIWVCLMPATLIFLISFSISICQINSPSLPCDTTFNGLEGRQQSVL